MEFIVPWPPGDLEDVLTQMIAEDFQKKYGTPAAVVNKPGGGGGPFPGAIGVATAQYRHPRTGSGQGPAHVTTRNRFPLLRCVQHPRIEQRVTLP